MFLGYEVDEELPWHSTVSRTRQLFPAAVFERLFDHVFAQCVNQGLVAGDTQAVDSAPVKANASLEAVREKQAAGTCGPLLAPDARIYIKSGKARALNYLCRLAVDTAKGVISPVQADYADQRDSRHLPRLLTGLQQRLRTNDRRGHELLADAGYTNGSNYAWLEAAYITPWIPVFGQYKAEIECFTSHLQQDVYHCRAGKALSFRKYDTTADGTWLKSY